jgi:dTDP-4-dehydrorhamnose 3,5-epimerase
MHVLPTGLDGVRLVKAEPSQDERGSFSRFWDADLVAREGLEAGLSVLAASWNPRPGTLRGMHWQEPPAQEVKLVRCTRGRVFDVAVDVRRGSPTYLRWWGVELGAGDGQALYLGSGMAHGFLTLDPDSEVQYLMTDTYDPERARGFRHDDPLVGISWPRPVECVSARDRGFPGLSA